MRVTVVARSVIDDAVITDSGVMALKRFVDSAALFPVTEKSTVFYTSGLGRQSVPPIPDSVGRLDQFEFTLNDDCTYTVTARFVPKNRGLCGRPKLRYTCKAGDREVLSILGIHLQ